MTLRENKPNVCIVSGYGWSGSGAVIDCLKELENVKTFDVEYRGIKDPYGLLDLERALTTQWDLLNSDFAIRNFIKLAEMHGKNNSKATKYRLSYEKKINKEFLSLTQKYVDSLITSSVNFSWWQRYIHSGWLGHMVGKFLAKVDYPPPAYFSIQSKEDFAVKTIDYLESLFVLNNTQLTVLDQAVSPNNVSDGLKYFRSPRMLIVDRNPFDVLADLRINKALMGTKKGGDEIENFALFYNAARAGSVNIDDANVKIIEFEKLINDYASTRSELLKFLELEESENPAKFNLFDPAKSKKNIGIYKQHLEDNEVKTLSRLLNYDPPE